MRVRYSRPVETRQLGHSGLRVSAIGLGSWLTLGSSIDPRATAALVEHAVDLGINFFDTAEAYGTETIVGLALRQLPRDSVVISTKSRIRRGGKLVGGGDVVANLDASLQRLTPVFRLSDRFVSGQFLHHAPQPGACRRFVVDNQYSHRLFRLVIHGKETQC